MRGTYTSDRARGPVHWGARWVGYFTYDIIVVPAHTAATSSRPTMGRGVIYGSLVRVHRGLGYTPHPLTVIFIINLHHFNLPGQ